MGIKLLLDYLSKKSASDDPIDFIKLAKGLHENGSNANPDAKMTLVVDGESCLNRLYGGFYSDWICGGQWNRMESFICDLMSKVSQAKIEMVVFFNGAIEPQRLDEWIRNQRDDFFKMCRILNEVDRTSEAPKAYGLWTPPVGVRSAIRMKLREMNVNVVSTIDDHRQEVIAYCRENDFYGLIADDAEYIAFQPTKLFSAMNLKLRYRGTLETKEFKISEFMTEFGLNGEKLCVLAALLGNYLLTHKELKDVYEKADIQMVPGNNSEKKYEKFPDDTVPKLAKLVNQLNVSTDLDSVVEQIFGKEDKRAARLKQSIQYYLNGTKEGFLKYHSVSTGKTDKEGNAKESDAIQDEADLDTGRLAPEKTGNVSTMMSEFGAVTAGLENELEDTTKKKQASSSDPDPNDRLADKGEKKVPPPVLPQVSHEVMRTLSERHSKGLMSPYIYQILSQGEIKLPVVMQKYNEDLPNIYEFYKPIRQMVYAIVFNLHHHKYTATKEKKPLEVDIRIKEWVFNVEEKIHKPEYVKAVPVGWGVPTIQRLWFGTLQDDKRRRLRAFLTCMRSDVQLILNPDFVPQELLMAAVVLRYIMSFPEVHILRKQELDAFIVTALTLESSDPNVLQDLKDPISSRNVQLAVLFMKGVEMALLVNDACGAPIPWLMCCPWLFFNGKLFNHTFQKSITCKNLQELCGSRLAYVVRAERMRQAILEGLTIQFARPLTKPPFAMANDYTNPGAFRNQQLPPPNLNRSVLGDNSSRGKRSLGASLKVAGVVTSSWGANYNMTRPSYDGTHYIRPNQVSASNSFNNCGYRSRLAFNATPKGKSFKFLQYGNKKDNNVKRKPAMRGGRGRGRGGLTVGSSSSTFTNNDLPNGNDTNPVLDDKFDSVSVVVVNGAAASTLNDENNEINVLDVGDVADDLLSTVAVIGAE